MKFITILLLSFLIITGCNQDQGASNTQKNDGNETPINVKNSVEEHVDRKTGQEISKHLVELATQIPEVNDATAVVLGQFAVIGIDVNSKLDRNKVETINFAKKRINKFNPDIIISDFEPLSNHYSIISRKPLISLDNQHINTKCNISFPTKFKADHLITSAVISSIITNAKYFIITSLIKQKTKNKNVFIFNPIIRKEIQQAKTKNKGYILVYQTSKSYKKLIPTLKNTPYKYIFYSTKNKIENNIQFKKFQESEFIKDLAEAKAVITNGGFGLISEAIYLKKPILTIPVKKQFEQIFNALTIEKLNYGEFQEEISEETITNFLKNLKKYKYNLKKVKNQDNSKLIKKLEQIINKSC